MEDFSKELLNWYLQNRRDLPWRNTRNPYYIWLSEVILQQTRVDQGLSYYLKFIEEFPEIKDLANAPQQKILRTWQGLGYYSRARNLHEAAIHIYKEYDGKFPEKYTEIRALKGIGDYTAAAISSFAFDHPYPVVDGNVYRFLSRFFGISTPIDSVAGKKEFAALALKNLDLKNPGTYNQAIMEFGALVCKPALPSCHDCSFSPACIAFNSGQVENLPVKEKKTKVRTRHFNFLIIHNGEEVLIGERKNKDIWQGLFEFPLVETEKPVEAGELISSEIYQQLVQQAIIEKVSDPVKHVLSHQLLLTRFWWINKEKIASDGNYRSVKIDELDFFGMPQLIVKYLKSAKINFLRQEESANEIPVRKNKRRKSYLPIN